MDDLIIASQVRREQYLDLIRQAELERTLIQAGLVQDSSQALHHLGQVLEHRITSWLCQIPITNAAPFCTVTVRH